MNNTIEIIPHAFADALSKVLYEKADSILHEAFIHDDPYKVTVKIVLDPHQLRRLIFDFITKHD